MSRIASRLAEMGLELPEPPRPLATYVPAVTAGEGVQVLVSGQVPIRDGEPMARGRVPSEVSIESAQRCAQQCVLNALAALRAEIGSLDRLKRVLRLGVFVACDPGFGEQPRVANGASDLLGELLGEAGRHARAAVGVASLPLNVPVEIEFTFLVEPG